MIARRYLERARPPLGAELDGRIFRIPGASTYARGLPPLDGSQVRATSRRKTTCVQADVGTDGRDKYLPGWVQLVCAMTPDRHGRGDDGGV